MSVNIYPKHVYTCTMERTMEFARNTEKTSDWSAISPFNAEHTLTPSP